jgi:hypothetical protein
VQLLTASRLKAFRRCARLHHLSYDLGYRPAVDAEALRFGTLVHRGLEVWWRALLEPGTLDPLEAALANLDGAIDSFERARAEVMLIGYHARWIDAGLVPLAVESEFRTPLLNPATGGRSPIFELGGKFDVVARDAAGRLLVIEHKTAGDTSIDYFTRLRLDGQVSQYVNGARAVGYDVEAVLYDVLVKPAQRPLKATPTESRKYTKDGRLYAAQRDRDETLDEYRERVAAEIEGDPEKYFKRVEVVRLEAEQEEYAFDLWATARTMRESELAGRAPRNMDSCERPGRCPYWSHCYESASLDDPSLFKKLANVHPELANGA